ncbi:MAG: hypothetical protein WCL08_12625 [Verrucomicrobiota bacterium]
MPSIPFDALARRCVRRAGVSKAFPDAIPLPSVASAGQHPLFGEFFGTMGISDFSSAWMAELRFPFPAPPGDVPAGTDETSQLLFK